MRYGCLDGCVHRRSIRITEMKERYAFRCAALKRYMTAGQVRASCRHFSTGYEVHQPSIEDFFND